LKRRGAEDAEEIKTTNLQLLTTNSSLPTPQKKEKTNGNYCICTTYYLGDLWSELYLLGRHSPNQCRWSWLATIAIVETRQPYSPSSNYLSGAFFANNAKNFFSFFVDSNDIGNDHIQSASLLLDNLSPSSGSLAYTVYDFSGPHSTLVSGSAAAVVNAIGNGATYGGVPNANASTSVNIVLNSSALTELRSLDNEFFDVGGLSPASGVSAFRTSQNNSTVLQLNLTPNVAPVADLADLTIFLGEDVSLDGSGSTDANINVGDSLTSFMWDLDDDGIFDTTTSVPTISLSASQLAGFGLGVGDHDISLKVTDIRGSTNTTFGTLSILSVPEPSSLLLGALASLGMLVRRRRLK